MDATMVRLQPVYVSNREEKEARKRGGQKKRGRGGESSDQLVLALALALALQVLHEARVLLAPRSDDALEGHRLAIRNKTKDPRQHIFIFIFERI